MKTLCPFCFEEYDVDASSMFQEATCLKCDKKFFVQPAKKCKVCGAYYDAAKVTCRNCGAVDSAEIESTAELHGQKYTDTGNGEEIFQGTDEKAQREIIRRYKFFNIMYRICRITTLFFWVLSAVLVLLNGLGLAISSLFISILPLAGMIIFRRVRDTVSSGGSCGSIVGLVIVGIILILVASCVSSVINSASEREKRRSKAQEENARWMNRQNEPRTQEEWKKQKEAEQKLQEETERKRLEEKQRQIEDQYFELSEDRKTLIKFKGHKNAYRPVVITTNRSLGSHDTYYFDYTVTQNNYIFCIVFPPDENIKKGIAVDLLYLPESVKTIGKGAFADRQDIIYIKLSYNDLETIENEAFRNCTGLIKAEIHCSNLHSLDRKAFDDFRKVAINSNTFKSGDHGEIIDVKKNKLLWFPPEYDGEYIIPDNIINIAPGAFTDCKVSKVTISPKVRFIPAKTFVRCGNLSEVTLKNKYAKVRANTFVECNNVKIIR